MTARISVDRTRCLGAGQCALAVAEVFDQDDKGVVLVVQPEPHGDQVPAARQAAELCPTGAITVTESS